MDKKVLHNVNHDQLVEVLTNAMQAKMAELDDSSVLGRAVKEDEDLRKAAQEAYRSMTPEARSRPLPSLLVDCYQDAAIATGDMAVGHGEQAGGTTLDGHQEDILDHAFYRGNWAYLALALNEEAGEVAGHVKKALRDEHGKLTEDRRESLLKELGDVLWYTAVLGHVLGYRLSEVAVENIRKLEARKVRGTLRGSGDDR
jgi:NTP pyrophosphatase (non-canonical NTP hydrolase)